MTACGGSVRAPRGRSRPCPSCRRPIRGRVGCESSGKNFKVRHHRRDGERCATHPRTVINTGILVRVLAPSKLLLLLHIAVLRGDQQPRRLLQRRHDRLLHVLFLPEPNGQAFGIGRRPGDAVQGVTCLDGLTVAEGNFD